MAETSVEYTKYDPFSTLWKNLSDDVEAHGFAIAIEASEMGDDIFEAVERLLQRNYEQARKYISALPEEFPGVIQGEERAGDIPFCWFTTVPRKGDV